MHNKQQSITTVLLFLAALSIAFLLAYLFYDLPPSLFDYAFPKRVQKSIGVIIAGIAVAISSVGFQTITNNRILTPAIIGFDALYMLLQGFIIFATGAAGVSIIGAEATYILTVGLLVIFGELLFKFLFQEEQTYIYFILLAGVVCGMVFRAGFNFFTLLLSPEEYDIVQTKMFASFSLISPSLLVISGVFIIAICLYSYRMLPSLDVFLLGRENAHNLGVDTSLLQKRMLRLIAILVAVSTALVGPITFLGLMVVNIAYQVIPTYRHWAVILGTILISWISLFGGMLLVERLIDFTTNLTVVINGIGGTYFIYLLLKEGR